jgi:hypothetical protein
MRNFSSRSTPSGVTILRASAMIAVASARLKGGSCNGAVVVAAATTQRVALKDRAAAPPIMSSRLFNLRLPMLFILWWDAGKKTVAPDEGRVPHISLFFREMWDSTDVDR